MSSKLKNIKIQLSGYKLGKINFLQEKFNLSSAETERMLQNYPLITSLSKENINEKIDFYLKELNLSQSEINKIVKLAPRMLTIGLSTVRKKIAFYQEEFGLDKVKLAAMLKLSPMLLCNGVENVKDKTNFFMEELGVEKAEFKKMFKKFPVLVSYGKDMIRKKINFYENTFNLDRSELSALVKSIPCLLSFDEAKIKAKVKFYQQEFNFSESEFISVLKKMPVVLALSINSVKEKAVQIKELNITKAEILHAPNIFAVPKNNLKLRYIILRQSATRKEILRKKGAFLTNQEKLYARTMYLQNKYGEATFNQIMKSEDEFVRVNKITSEELMEQYKLTTEVIDQMQKAVYHYEMQPFNANEKTFIESEYGINY